MNTKIMFISIGIVIAVAIGFFVYRTVQYDAKSSGKVNTSTNSSPQSVSSQAVQEYSDPAGFKFSYPDSASVSPKNTTDDNTYSSLEITSTSTAGKITIDAVSSDLLTLDDMLVSKAGITNVKLADLTAKQYTEKGSLITLALDEGVLFTITTSSGGNVDYWNEVNSRIISSFTFALPETTQVQSDTPSQSADSDISFEGEETIE